MSLILQIVFGIGVLIFCSLLHFAAIVGAVNILQKMAKRFEKPQWSLLVAVAFTAIVSSHLIQVWIWAAAFVALTALPNLSDAIYFSIVTYTTVGYGDVTVTQDFRVFAAMAAVTGLLNFGLSTAFLVAMFTRMLDDYGKID
jgi:Ion channel